ARHQRGQVRLLEEELATTVTRLTRLHEQVQADKAEHLEQMRHAAHRQNDAIAAKAQVDNLRREHNRLRSRTAQAAERLAALDVALEQLTQADQALQDQLSAARQDLTDRRQERDQARTQLDRTGERLSDLRQKRSGVASRIEVLQGLIRGREGLDTGVREVL